MLTGRSARCGAYLILLGASLLSAAHAETPAEAAYRALREGRLEAAIAGFREAIAAEPEDARRAALSADLGYVHLKRGEETEAREAFLAARAHGHDDPRLLLEIAYSYRRTGEDEAAARWFRRYLDQQSALVPPEQILRARREVRTLENRLDGAASLFYRTEGPPDRQLGLGARSLGGSQGLFDIRYRLAGRPERYFAPFSRLLWAIDGVSPVPSDDSLQAGFGLLAKPFPRKAFFLAAERLVALGRNARSDWLARASWSAGEGSEAPPERPDDWLYWSAFADLAVIGTDRPDLQIIGEARAGHGFGLGKELSLIGFVFASALIEDVATGTASQYEAGPGLMLSLGLGGTEHKAAARRLDLITQYRLRIAGNSADSGGFVLQLVFGF
ncbi:MAG: hypothetical protein Kow00104_03590 [Rhodothalassiaceae bacterium]